MRMNALLGQLKLLDAIDGIPLTAKRCPSCSTIKRLSEFSSRTVMEPKPCSYCRSCQREYCKLHYQRNRPAHNVRRYRRQKNTRLRLIQLVAQYKIGAKCVDCGEADPIVLEFDHVRGTKKGNISRMLCTATWSKIQEEIAKCELRCANCHRRKTARDLGWKVRAQSAER